MTLDLFWHFRTKTTNIAKINPQLTKICIYPIFSLKSQTIRSPSMQLTSRILRGCRLETLMLYLQWRSEMVQIDIKIIEHVIQNTNEGFCDVTLSKLLGLYLSTSQLLFNHLFLCSLMKNYFFVGALICGFYVSVSMFISFIYFHWHKYSWFSWTTKSTKIVPHEIWYEIKWFHNTLYCLIHVLNMCTPYPCLKQQKCSTFSRSWTFYNIHHIL